MQIEPRVKHKGRNRPDEPNSPRRLLSANIRHSIGNSKKGVEETHAKVLDKIGQQANIMNVVLNYIKLLRLSRFFGFLTNRTCRFAF